MPPTGRTGVGSQRITLSAGNLLRAAMLALGMAALFALNNQVAHAQGDPGDYTFTSLSKNFYNQWPLTMGFASLDTTHQYTWTVQRLNAADGSVIDSLGQITSSGSATATKAFSPIIWPDHWTGPLQVIDDLGQRLGYWFVAETPHDDWELTVGETAEDAKQVVGVPQSNGVCAAPPYATVDVNGWHHSPRPCKVQTGQDKGFALLHFRADAASYPVDEQIVFQLMPSPSEVFTIDVDDMIDYNFDGFGGISSVQTESFVVIATDTHDQLLPWFDPSEASAAFNNEDNPYLLDLATGAYSCLREDATTLAWISDCESVWLVSNAAPNLDITFSLTDSEFLNEEWTVRANLPTLGPGGTQIVTLGQKTEAIWSAYNGAWDLIDERLGIVDSNTYSYSVSRNFSYDVDTVEDSSVIILWGVEPSAIESGEATPAERAFAAFDTYAIFDAPTFRDDVQTLIQAAKLHTPFGNIVVLLLLLILGIIGMGALATALRLPGELHVLGQMLVFTGIGGMLIFWGVTTTLTTILFLAADLAMWAMYFAFGMGRRQSV